MIERQAVDPDQRPLGASLRAQRRLVSLLCGAGLSTVLTNATVAIFALTERRPEAATVPLVAWLVGAPTFLVVSLSMHRTLRRGAPGKERWWLIGPLMGPLIFVAIAAQALLTSAVAQAGSVRLQPSLSWLVVVAMVLMIAAVPGTIVGLLLTLLTSGPLGAAEEAKSSFDGLERLLSSCGRWLSWIAGLSAAASGLAHLGAERGWGFGTLLMAALDLLLLGASLGLTQVARRRLRRRRLWVDEVRRGCVQGWAVLGADEVEAEGLSSLRPLFSAPRALVEPLILARLTPVEGEDGPYRSGERWVPVALIEGSSDR